MKNRLAGICVLVILIASLLLASMPATATVYRDDDPSNSTWSTPPTGISALWTTDQTMYTNKGGMPMFNIYWANTQAASQTVTLRARLVGYNASWSTGWRIDCVASTDPADAFQTTTGLSGEGTFGTYTDYYTQSATGSQTTTGQSFSIFVDVPDAASESTVTIQCNITNAAAMTRSENATLHIQNNVTYNIQIGANAL